MIPALFVTLLAAATATAPLEPSGKWMVDYRTDMCLASRPFGTDTPPLTFAVKPSVVIGGNGASFFILTKNEGNKDIRRGTAELIALPSGTKLRVDYVSWMPNTLGGLRGFQLDATSSVMEAMQNSTALSVTAGRASFTLKTGKMQPLFNALSACNDNLFRAWGVDPTARADPLGSPGNWFNDDDFPGEAKSAGAQGRVIIVLTINAEGKPTACRVAVSSKNPALDQTACRLAMARGRFTPLPGKSDRFSVLSTNWVLGG